KNQVEFMVRGKLALFTDPLTKIGGEKCSYHIPTYEALKGVAKSVYWKPTFTWIIDKVRVMNQIRTQAKNVKPVNYSGVYPSMKDPSKKKEESFHTLSIYTYLLDVEYQVQAHFEWNLFREDMAKDRIDGKHWDIAKRMIEKGGRQDIFLGTRECQGYVEPCVFGAGQGHYDTAGELAYGIMFHGFDYPDETGKTDEDGKPDQSEKYRLHARFWRPTMINGVVTFLRPEDCCIRKFVREMTPKPPQSDGLQEPVLIAEMEVQS
ncbi:MAG: type I-C CRISPR-associated protein Cas5, partial [Lentisphaerae bacterium]|nr:type I-C CRISPR-associated protein Cas5 [Lentisphaerota bacterium]